MRFELGRSSESEASLSLSLIPDSISTFLWVDLIYLKENSSIWFEYLIYVIVSVLVSLFNIISLFKGYLISQASLGKNSGGSL